MFPDQSAVPGGYSRDLNEVWVGQLSLEQMRVWQQLEEQGVQASWEADPERFVVSRGDQVLATHLRRKLPVNMVVVAALYEAGHKLEVEQPELNILPPVVSP